MKVKRVTVDLKREFLINIQTIYDFTQVNIIFLLLRLWHEISRLNNLTQSFYVWTDEALENFLTVWWLLILKDLLRLRVKLFYFLFYFVMDTIIKYFEDVVLF